ncbi:FAD-dependent oxidoreductase [Rhodococcus sp. LB1]|uniref:FAD-dependent oxidoreductase n=1 Tax=Rhodococcus sp. LB1 TaxID=1807499 RepID=UPI00077A9542|nr:FAD-dependent oxidoreductase [Rhodococcus sp. LB1]KXX58964.1 hypothetical protein AZG88_43355 [Rhodococcus sp. LB1]
MTDRVGHAPEERVDVIVVGGGAAGLLAAIDAAEQGASVLLFEKNSDVGGKTKWSIGTVTAGGTTIQSAKGINDSPEQHRKDVFGHAEQLGTLRLPGVEEKLEVVVENAATAIDRLVELGLGFGGPHPEEMHSQYRGHVLFPNPMVFVGQLAQKAREHGVRIRRDTRVESLLVESDGRVTGVRVGGRGIHAGAVVVCAGDYSAAAPGRTPPAHSAHAFKQWATGDGHFMAADVGAKMLTPEGPVFAALTTLDTPTYFGHPVVLMGGAIVVNQSGERVGNELAMWGQDYAERTSEDLYLVIGGRQIERLATVEDDGPDARDGWYLTGKSHLGNIEGVGYAYESDLVDIGYAKRSESISGVAELFQIERSALQTEIDKLDEAHRSGSADRLGREWSENPFDRGPYLAIGPFRGAVALGTACIACDRDMRALDTKGDPIVGLFVAGDTADYASIGFATGSHGYGLAWAFVSGMIAGRSAASVALKGAPIEALPSSGRVSEDDVRVRAYS